MMLKIEAVLLDGSKWSELAFVEKAALHYSPLKSKSPIR